MKHTANSTTDAVASAVLDADLWDAVPQLFADWASAIRAADKSAAACAEQKLRPVALTYASMLDDGTSVTTGRKAILRSIYDRLGTPETTYVSTMLDRVITREEASARHGETKGKVD